MSRWLKLLLFVLAVAGGGLALLPWWLGAALRPVLRAQGVTFDRYERVDYAHFRLHGVHQAGAGFSLAARQVQALTPVAWLVQCLRGAEPTLLVDGWRVTRETAVSLPSTRGTDGPASNQADRRPINGLPDLHATLRRLGPRAAYWVPRVRLTAGEICGFGRDATIASVDWRRPMLSVEGLQVAGQAGGFVVSPAPDGTVVLSAHTAGRGATLRLEWSDAELRGAATLWGQPVELAARFPAAGWLPAEARVVAENWRLPAARVKLGLPYAEIRGEARLLWRDQAFALSLSARAEPVADTPTQAPPFTARVAAHGNLRELTLTALQVDAPFVTASLSAPVTLGLDRPLASAPARLQVRADLAKMPWLEARGRAEGTVSVAGDTAAARQEFELSFSDVAAGSYAVKSARARGTLVWPRLELDELAVQLDDASAFEARGAVDWRTRELAGVALQARFGSAWFARWLPPETGWERAEITATATGPLAAPRHEGSLRLSGAHHPPLHPFALAATWQGLGEKLDISATATAQHSTLEFAGTLEPDRLHLARLKFAPGAQGTWELAAPAQLAWSPVWELAGFDLIGPDSRLALSGRGGPEAAFTLTAANVSSSWLQDWAELPGPGWQVQSLQATGRLAGGALVFDTALAAQIEMSPLPVRVKLAAGGDAAGVRLREFAVTAEERVLTRATGRLPLVWRVDPAGHLLIDEELPLELSAAAAPDSPLWATLAKSTGLQLTTAAASLNVQGTLRQPAGELQVKVARLAAAPDRFKFPLPEITDLDLGLQFGRQLVTVSRFSAKLDGQALAASGRLPMDDDRWRLLGRRPAAFDWSQAAVRVEIPDADLAPLARRYPAFLAPEGRLHARLELSPGGKFSGELQVTDAASRPLGSLGSLRDIRADLQFADRQVTVRSFTASLGGEPLSLDGSVTLPAGGAPRLALGLKGLNLPLVRNTGLLLRSDLDLRADTDAAGITRLSGAVNVRDCLVLAKVNLRTLRPGGRRGVTRPPPYFAVAAEPFRDWELAVAVRAPGAVRARTTVYSGTMSAAFRLDGTLGEPRAVGALTVDQGLLLFPFAAFKVQQGAVRLREADPFRAMVSLTALSERRDYQLRLEMNGELPAPNVTVTSTPALEAEEVLLMVMAGQPPASDTTAASSTGQRFALLGAYLGKGLFQELGFSGEERLEVSAGTQISRSGRETYEFEYRMDERWSLLGEYDEYDAYNAGLKWRVYTEEGTPREKK